jgi:hypothetical protein
MKPSLAKDLESKNPTKLAAIKKVHGIVDKPVVIIKPITKEAAPKQHRFIPFKNLKESDEE